MKSIPAHDLTSDVQAMHKLLILQTVLPWTWVHKNITLSDFDKDKIGLVG